MFFAVTQVPNKGEIVRVFDVWSDGLFPDTELGNCGLKHWKFKELISY